MIDQLKKAVYKRFGPVYGSLELKAARDKLCEQCWEVYKQERWAGIATMEAALQAALPTPEQVEAARAPYFRKGMAVAYWAILVLSAIPLLRAAVACVRAFAVYGFHFSPLLFLAVTAGLVWLILKGIFRMLYSSKRGIGVLFLLIGFPLLLLDLLCLFLLVDPGKLYSYDYTDRIDSVESIDWVQLDDFRDDLLFVEEDEGGVLRYTVLETLGSERYEPLLKELAGIRYHRTRIGDPRFLTRGSRMILIRFSSEQGDIAYAFYGCWDPGYVQQDGTAQRLTYEAIRCDDEKWDELVAGYFPGVPLR